MSVGKELLSTMLSGSLISTQGISSPIDQPPPPPATVSCADWLGPPPPPPPATSCGSHTDRALFQASTWLSVGAVLAIERPWIPVTVGLVALPPKSLVSLKT